MGRKQLITLIVVLAAVAGLAFVVRSRHSSSFEQPSAKIGEKVFPDFPVNDVSAVAIKTGDGEVRLSRKKGEDGTWGVDQREAYPADFAKVRDLLREMWELKVSQAVEAGPSQFARLELLAPDAEDEEGKGTMVEFLGSDDGVLASLLLGKEYQRESSQPSPFGGLGGEPAGRYLKRGDSQDVLLVSSTLSSLTTDPAEWLNKEFFKVEKLKSIEKASAKKDDDWKIERNSEGDNDSWRLLLLRPNEALDDAKIASLKSGFSNPRFDDVIAADSVGDGETKFTVTTFDGFTYDIAVGEELEDRKHHLMVSVDAEIPGERQPGEGESEEDKKKKDAEFAERKERLEKKLEQEKSLAGRVYVVPNWVISPLLKPRSDIIKDLKEDDTSKSDGDVNSEAGPAAPATGQAPAPMPGDPQTGDAPAKPRATAVTAPVGIDLTKNPPEMIPAPKIPDAEPKPKADAEVKPDADAEAKPKPADKGAEKK